MQHYKNTNFLVFPHTTNVIFCPTPKALILHISQERAAPCKSLLGPLGPVWNHGGGKREARCGTRIECELSQNEYTSDWADACPIVRTTGRCRDSWQSCTANSSGRAPNLRSGAQPLCSLWLGLDHRSGKICKCQNLQTFKSRECSRRQPAEVMPRKSSSADHLF
jgi:hypothetical protein